MNEPQVVYENKDFLVIQKPAGLIVHAPKHRAESSEPSVASWLIAHYPEVQMVGDDPVERPGIVHRLDKGTSGLLIIPRTQEAFDYFKSEFKKHAVRKTYLALVYGIPESSGTIDKPIGIKDGSVKRSVFATKSVKTALTRYEVRETGEREGEALALLTVMPETGRTHQIRVHLKSIGHPIVGDPLYGRKKEAKWVSRLMLHALNLEFTTPDGRRLRLETDIPPGFSLG